MKAAAFHQYIFRQLDLIEGSSELNLVGKVKASRNLLVRLFELATESDRLHFSTIQARIAYVAHRNGFSGQLVYQIHRFRRSKLNNQTEELLQQLLITGYKATMEVSSTVFNQPVPKTWLTLHNQAFPNSYREPDVVGFHQNMRVVALEIDREEQQLIVREEAKPTETWKISYATEESSDQIREAITIIDRIVGLPVILNLHRLEIHQSRLIVPQQIIIDPDYLIDVTAVASSFGGKDSVQPWAALSRRLLPYEQRLPLLKGNVVNLFLDVLVNEPDTDFKTLAAMIFQIQPLALCCLKDAEVKQLITELKGHYQNLRIVIKQGLDEKGIRRENSQLEPSFYSPDYGLQGRLDLLHRAQGQDGQDQTSIIELKSGKVFMPNKHGLNQSHFVQTLLYDLMINRAFGKSANVASYILYSQSFDRPLRYAPPERFTQVDALTVRNQLLAIEALIAKLGVTSSADLLTATNALIRRLRPNNFRKLSPFTEKDFNRIITKFEALSEIEKRYFGAFLGFIAREHRLAKTGEQGVEKLNGLASLWLDEPTDKFNDFDLLAGLKMTNYDPQTATISFDRPQTSEQMVKFRKGDIVVLYACKNPSPEKGEILGGQIFKSTIVELAPNTVVLRLRSRQLSDRLFRQQPFWAIEKDVLDSSFSNHYRGLWAWAESNPERRQLLLGQIPPNKAVPPPLSANEQLTQEQSQIMANLLAAPNYFLLWGPPGTGKTSMMLHHMLAHLLANTKENVLIVAYTNRAVDEICESIERIDGGFRDYIRIGSRFGTADQYQDRLLSIRSEAFTTRVELLAMIHHTRVFVGTVASIGGKEELFKLKQFDRIIVDEASQILEPLLLGLLVRIPKAVLIGDHRQLPAVVQQPQQERQVSDSTLHEMGIRDLSISLFERLYRRAKENNWHWCYDQLRFQGRMHQDIMAFPASAFYEGTLEILPAEIPARQRQLQRLDFATSLDTPLKRMLANQRLQFLPTPVDLGSSDHKTNRHEAQKVIEIIGALEEIYAGHQPSLQAGDIGIITPYRAQIANIRRHLTTAGYQADHFTVDTVERYQGGARRIIIISFCTNNERQMEALSQTNDEQIDRKLNVAMTRAREQLILVGCPEILNTIEHYRKLLKFIKNFD